MKTEEKKVVLVTGASSGFGQLTAEKLLEQGHIVYATARRVERMDDLKKKGARILKIDVTDNDSIITGVKQIIEEEGKIDVLLNNAGYGTYGIVECVPMEEIQRQYDVNVFGMGRVLQAVLPYMRERKKGRIVITTSIVSHISMAGLGWYASTKHALTGMSIALRQEVKNLGIDVVMIEPGTVKTGFDSVAFATFDKIEHPADYEQVAKGFRKFLAGMYAKSPGPESTVAAMVEAVNARKPKTVYKTTSDAKRMPRMMSLFSDRTSDKMMLSQINKAARK
jgi:NADP-dependent 3-hydroxy acid dehydrogenase YdfG